VTNQFSKLVISSQRWKKITLSTSPTKLALKVKTCQQISECQGFLKNLSWTAFHMEAGDRLDNISTGHGDTSEQRGRWG
jgi:hypothetical protein